MGSATGRDLHTDTLSAGAGRKQPAAKLPRGNMQPMMAGCKKPKSGKPKK